MKQAFTLLYSILLAALLAAGLSGCRARVEPAPADPGTLQEVGEEERGDEPPQEADKPDLDFDAITAGFDFEIPRALTLTRPTGDITTQAEGYYLIGLSDPDRALVMNGAPVAARGARGTFGVFVELEEGENVFTFAQEDEEIRLVITRSDEEGDPATTDRLSRMRPEIAAAAVAEASYSLSCVAPSGSAVSARVGEKTVALEQVAATSLPGVPATFAGDVYLDAVEGTHELGPVVYILTQEGETTEYMSEGSLFVVGAGDELVVRGVDVAATVFADASDEGYYSILPESAIDIVTEIGDSMYRLGMGGWVFKQAVAPVTGQGEYRNSVSAVLHTVAEGYEMITLSGTSSPPYRAQWEDGELEITLFHTSGVEAVPLEGSTLLEKVTVRTDQGNTILRFLPGEGVQLGGYLVENGENRVAITLRERPAVSGALPLSGITVLLDAGHGGSDVGTEGITFGSAPLEKELTLATAQVVRRYLERMGAEVLMTRETDDTVDMNTRLAAIRTPEVDFVISLHCNSIGLSRDGTEVSGAETFFFDSGSEAFAAALNSAVCARTGRKDRGPKSNYFKVTLHTGAPAVLLEMGFMTSPAEYDALCSKESAYAVAEAIAQTIVDSL